jgi:hypothetical protein
VTKLQILAPEVDRVHAELYRDVKADDDLRCLAILRDEHKDRRLGGDWRDWRIRAWDQRRGWIVHPDRSNRT